jgi:hypothetical protein
MSSEAEAADSPRSTDNEKSSILEDSILSMSGILPSTPTPISDSNISFYYSRIKGE